MAERSARRHPAFRFLIPQWRGTARASQRPPSRRKIEPPSSSQTTPQSSQTQQELANAAPAAQQTKASLTGVEKNGEASQRRDTSQEEHPSEEFQIKKTSQADEDEQHEPFQTIMVEASQETKREAGIKQVTSSELEYISEDKAEVADQNVQPSKPPKVQLFGNGELEQSIYPIQTTAEKAAEELQPEEGRTKREKALEEDTSNNQLTEEPKRKESPSSQYPCLIPSQRK
ncbi:hypothetical protein HPP92_004793 [Vanilla planifolia]|uniref:Uncharacterized protein n=1 Tax=Vanilla planifolia TaxID=51239 RepID=A0A835VC03_VANPL|nr:hypothetical protein HPP92_004793 [Vanilla planifolia]